MTALKMIPDNHLALDCPCGHTALVPVADLIARTGGETRVSQVVARSRCRKCGQRGSTCAQIIYCGASISALSSARQDMPDHAFSENGAGNQV